MLAAIAPGDDYFMVDKERFPDGLKLLMEVMVGGDVSEISVRMPCSGRCDGHFFIGIHGVSSQ